MGFDVTAVSIIFFITAIGSASAILGAYWHDTHYLEEARKVGDAQADGRTHTNMTVTSASYNGGASRFTLEIKSTGSETIDITTLHYVVDGAIVPLASVQSASIPSAGSTDLWLPLETLEVQLSPISPSPTFFQVIAENGAKANWRS